VVVNSLATYTYSAQVLGIDPFNGDLQDQLGDNQIMHPLVPLPEILATLQP
jgi:hypothetical protein